jgi:hypothetical protein
MIGRTEKNEKYGKKVIDIGAGIGGLVAALSYHDIDEAVRDESCIIKHCFTNPESATTGLLFPVMSQLSNQWTLQKTLRLSYKFLCQ